MKVGDLVQYIGTQNQQQAAKAEGLGVVVNVSEAHNNYFAVRVLWQNGRRGYYYNYELESPTQ